ncbi:MAG: DGQHR domain-containing protein [Candidatus Thermoplasmatota archaeon]
MLSTKIMQKDSEFYFVNYPAQDLLNKVRFISRCYMEGEEIPSDEKLDSDDEIVEFISKIERTDKAFQRRLMKRKVKAIWDFYRNANDSPLIPGAILLYTPEKLNFEPMGEYKTVGELTEPNEKFYIIDGQHRLAGLYFFCKENPEIARNIYVPTMVFDGKQESFASEMFVIINSTHTRINKSHLVDLMEKVTFGTTPEKKFAAKIVSILYENPRSPLRYKINRLGGRSRQEKWILQSELYNEIHKLTQDPVLKKYFEKYFSLDGNKAGEMFIDYFKAVSNIMTEIWGNKNFMFTESVTIKAMVRVFGELIKDPGLQEQWRMDKSPKVFEEKIKNWPLLSNEFRRDGFYERFPAKGHIERVRRIKDRLLKSITMD